MCHKTVCSSRDFSSHVYTCILPGEANTNAASSQDDEEITILNLAYDSVMIQSLYHAFDSHQLRCVTYTQPLNVIDNDPKNGWPQYSAHGNQTLLSAAACLSDISLSLSDISTVSDGESLPFLQSGCCYATLPCDMCQTTEKWNRLSRTWPDSCSSVLADDGGRTVQCPKDIVPPPLLPIQSIFLWWCMHIPT
jgi:hypothetical protein